MENRTEQKMRSYDDFTRKLNIDTKSFDSLALTSSYPMNFETNGYASKSPNTTNDLQSIDRGVYSSKKNVDVNNMLLSRQLLPATLVGTNNEQKTRIPDSCMNFERNIDMNNVLGHNESLLGDSIKINGKFGNLNAMDIMTDDDIKLLSAQYNNTCSQRKKDLNFGDYMLPGNHVSGRGFGNPNNYYKTYLGQDTRLNNQNNPRSLDFEDRMMVPLSGFRIDYANIPYSQDIRSGVSTRTSKKVNFTGQ
jgi:hypothetical protein